ncbi:MAG: hypothetical protein ACIALR_08715 [Blastopirellula sp. JB062]
MPQNDFPPFVVYGEEALSVSGAPLTSTRPPFFGDLSEMTDPNNPYYRWLGLSVYGRPDYYALLGLRTYESDPQIISAQGEQTFLRVQTQHGGAEEPSRQQILQEIAAARACLQNPAQKSVYDQQLQQYYAQFSAPQSGAAVPVAAPVQAQQPVYGAAPTGQPIAQPIAQPAGQPTAIPVPPGASGGETGSVKVVGSGPSTAKRAKSRASGGSKAFWGSALVLGLLVGGAVAGYWVFLGDQDPQEVAEQEEPADEIIDPVVGLKSDLDAPEEEKKKRPRRGRGKRPSAEDLAGSIPGLGDPNEKLEEMGEAPQPKPPAKPAPTAEQKQALQTAISTAWKRLDEKDVAAAQATLAAVAALNKTDAGEAEFKRLRQLVSDLAAFDQAVATSLEKLQGGEQLQVGSTQFTVASKTASHLVVRVAGQSRSYELTDIPEGLRRALATYGLAGDEPRKKLVEGSFLLFSSIADPGHAMEVWKQAAAQGADITEYVALEQERKRYAPRATKPTPPVESVAQPAMESGMEPGMRPDSPATAPLDETKLSPSDLGRLLTGARQALSDRQAEEAQRILAQAAPLAAQPEHQAKVARLQKLADLVQQFWGAVSQEIAELTAETDITVGKTLAHIVENRADYLVLRVNGENRRYTLQDIPAGLAMHFATERLADDEARSKLVRGSFLLVSPEAGADRAKAMWDEAKLAGAEVGDLPLTASDSYDFADDFLEQVEVPSEADLQTATAGFQKEWAEAFAAANSANGHTALARKLLRSGKATADDPPLSFVTFRYALAEAAKGGEMPLCDQIADAWSKRFAIDPLDWSLKAFQLAAASESPALQEKAAAYALRLVPRLLEAGRAEEAASVVSVAENAAKNSGDQPLSERLMRLRGTLSAS